MSKTKDKVSFNIWIKPEVKEALRKKAEEERRSMTNMAEIILEDDLEAYLKKI